MTRAATEDWRVLSDQLMDIGVKGRRVGTSLTKTYPLVLSRNAPTRAFTDLFRWMKVGQRVVTLNEIRITAIDIIVAYMDRNGVSSPRAEIRNVFVWPNCKEATMEAMRICDMVDRFTHIKLEHVHVSFIEMIAKWLLKNFNKNPLDMDE